MTILCIRCVLVVIIGLLILLLIHTIKLDVVICLITTSNSYKTITYDKKGNDKLVKIKECDYNGRYDN